MGLVDGIGVLGVCDVNMVGDERKPGLWLDAGDAIFANVEDTDAVDVDVG